MRSPHRIAVVCVALLAWPLSAQQPVRMTDAGVTLDFQDAELRVVLAALAEAGKLNVTFGEMPDRRVTLRLRDPVPPADILTLLRSFAQANGLRVEGEGRLLRIVVADRGRAEGALMAADSTTGEGGDVRLFVHRLKHVRAAKLAATLQAIFGVQRAAPAAPGLSTQSLSERLQEQRLAILAPDTAARAGIAGAAGSTAAGGGGLRAELRGPVQVVPDETTNALLVRALPSDWTIVEEAITALDLRPLQVMIEVLVAEVRQSRDLDVSVTGSAVKTADESTRTVGTLGGSEASTASFLLRLARGGTISTDVALSALATRGDVRVLSRPLLLAQNNLEAKIMVGSQRPFVQVFRSLPTDAGVRDQVVQYRDVGTTLAILPTINPDGYVSLQVSQEVSSATAETQFGAPVISTREASTHLFVRDGHTAVLGGLVDRQQEDTRSGIPWLSTLPGIGRLFGSSRATTINSELFLFLTPHIVASDDDLERIRGAVEQKVPPSNAPPANPAVIPRRPPQ